MKKYAISTACGALALSLPTRPGLAAGDDANLSLLGAFKRTDTGAMERVCAIGPDNKLYISMGQPFNMTPPDKVALYDKAGIGGITRMNRDGSGREIIVTGIRNSVGHAFNPKDGSLWFTNNQVDGMGDETPPVDMQQYVDGSNLVSDDKAGAIYRISSQGD